MSLLESLLTISSTNNRNINDIYLDPNEMLNIYRKKNQKLDEEIKMLKNYIKKIQVYAPDYDPKRPLYTPIIEGETYREYELWKFKE